MKTATKTERKTTRCAIYTRKSVTEGLDRDFNTLDAQREAGEAYIKSQRAEGWVCLEKQYDDGGFSGGTLERPALVSLLSDIEAGDVDCVVVYKVDRLSRSLLDFSRLVEVFDKHDVSFVSVTQPINTADSTGRLMLNILLSFAQFEREVIADRTRDKMRAARRRGKWTGGIPVLGYDVHPDGGKLVVNQDEAPMVREIFRLYLKRKSLSKVTAELQRRGWTTKSWVKRNGEFREGKPFSKSVVQGHLTNSLYIGCVRHRGQVFPGEHDGIIRKATFDKVQEILAENLKTGRTKSKNKYGFLLKGLLRCAACGTAYVPTRTKKGATIYRYYTCSSAQKNGWKTCPNPNLSAHALEQAIVDQIRVIGQDPKLQAATLKEVHRAAREQRAALDAEEKSLRGKLDAAESEKTGLLRALAGGEASGAAISDRLGDLEDRTATLAVRLAEIDRERAGVDRATVDPAEWTTALNLFDPVWDVLFPAEQARIIELLIDRIEYDGATDRLAVTFHPTGIKALAEEVATCE